jgi:hypothetical protein
MDAAHDPARSLHEVFSSLAGDPAADPGAALAAAGHAGLPPDLLTEAVVSYADTAPPEVAEHLSPVVLGASADPGTALDLLTSAPPVTWDDVPVDGDLAEAAPDVVDDLSDDLSDDVPDGVADDVADHVPDVPDLDFGAGDHESVVAADTADPADTADDLDALDDVPAVPDVPAAEPAVDDVLPAEDDLPTPDLAAEGWDDGGWDDGGWDGDGPDDDLDV